MSALTVLVVDDDDGVRYMLRGLLEDAGYAVVEARHGGEALELLEQRDVSLVLTDVRMPRMDGLELLGHLRGLPRPPRTIVLTAYGSERLAVEAMKLGAWDYFRKPFEPDELLAAVHRAVERVTPAEPPAPSGLVLSSEPMRELMELVRRVGPRDVTVLLQGETGAGKERVAEELVRASGRRGGPFVRFNCAAVSRDLAEAELFGHARGAFTGAHRARTGLFREAHGGTLLLDEVGELELGIQAKLLRVLQDGEVRPLGEDRAHAVDVRLVAATHRDLAGLVRDGAFREDLYYRLRVVQLRVPPLRERPADIEPLARHFLAHACARFGLPTLQLSTDVLATLRAHHWPGNVRELSNAVESLVALSDGMALDARHLSLALRPQEVSDAAPAPDPEPAAGAPDGLRERLEQAERDAILEALSRAGGNRTRAAQLLRIGRATLHEKLKKLGIE